MSWEERIVVLAPSRQDGPLMAEILESDGYDTVVCEQAGRMLDVVKEGAGAVVVTPEGLRGTSHATELVCFLRNQPVWSALPVIVITHPRAGKWATTLSLTPLQGMRGVTFLERPVRRSNLITLVRNTLQHRRLQYQVRDLLVEQAETQARLESQAHFDSLTGLSNRALLSERLEQALTVAQRRGRYVAVLFMDLDRFKVVNDSLGHEAGDALLCAVSERLLAVLRRQDTLARFGGDEFVILVEDLRDTRTVENVGYKILEAMRAPFDVGGHELVINASIGVSLFPGNGGDSSTLIRHADTALFRVKERGRNGLQFYSSAMTDETLEKMSLEQSLRIALDAGQLELYFQPRVSLQDLRVTSLEALLRWNHPDKGAIPPQHVVELAEECGMILPLADWVLQTACRQCRAWQDAGHTGVSVAVNLSAGQFIHAGLVERIETALQSSGLAPGNLELEITENILMGDTSGIIATLYELRDIGVTLSIDDFGIGHSSLGYLKRLPLNWLKIDKSFVQDVSLDEDAAAVTQAIISLAHHFKLRVIAEGMESEAQRQFLEANNCDEVQGFYFSHAVPGGEVTSLLERGRFERSDAPGGLPSERQG